MNSGVKELKLWQEAVALAADVVRLGRGAARGETKAVVDRLMLAAGEVASGVAAGYTHELPGSQRGAYVGARVALAEVETLLAVGRQAGVLPADPVLAATARAGTVHRLLGGYVAYLDRQLGESGVPPVAGAPPPLPPAAAR